MDLKRLYAAAVIRLEREIPLPRFLLETDTAVRGWLSKYPAALLLGAGAYFTPTSLDDSLPLDESFFPALLDAIVAAETKEEAAAKSSERKAENAYLMLWRAAARGKRIQGGCMVSTEKTKVGVLLDEIIDAFADSFALQKDFLLGEYNRLAAALVLLCPVPDAKLTVTAKDGRIACALTPAQYRRVFCGERECLRASQAMLMLLPDFPLYVPDESGAAVALDGDYTVCYRALPEAVSAENADTADIALDERFLPLLRAALMRSAYLYIGDTDAAKEYDALYTRALAAYKQEIGVSE